MTEIARVARALKEVTACDKLNIAALGNVVPQLHVHVIARRRDDAAWPKPVWGVVPPRAYEREAMQNRVQPLRKKIGSCRRCHLRSTRTRCVRASRPAGVPSCRRYDLGPKPLLGYTASIARPRAERRSDAAFLAALREREQRCDLCDRRRTGRAEEAATAPTRCSARRGARARAGRARPCFSVLQARPAASASRSIRKPTEALKARDDLFVTDLRSIAVQGLVDPEHLPPLAEAKALLHWHARHRFCANCGAPTNMSQAGWRRDCPSCKAQHFPRTDPVVDHAGGRRRALPARPRRPLRRQHVVVPRGLRRAGRDASRMRCGARRWRKPASPAAGELFRARSRGRSRRR